MFKTSSRDKRKSAERSKAKEGVFLSISLTRCYIHRCHIMTTFIWKINKVDFNFEAPKAALHFWIIHLINPGCQRSQGDVFFEFNLVFSTLTSSSQYIYFAGLQPNKKKADRARKRWKLLRNIFIAFRLKCSKKDKTKVSNHPPSSGQSSFNPFDKFRIEIFEEIEDLFHFCSPI